MTSDPRTAATTPTDDLLRGLLEPLLDARSSPATGHFDDALATALGSGRITPDLARELRFWQRASVHEVTDHVRTVLPAVLPVVLGAVAEAGRDADAAAQVALSAWQDRTSAVAEADEEDPAQVAVSTHEAEGAAMSPHARRRQFVAGLTSIA